MVGFMSFKDSKCTWTDTCQPRSAISITSPLQGTTTNVRRISVTGTVDPTPPGGTVEVLGIQEPIQADGSFAIDFFASDGVNNVEILVVDNNGDIIGSSFLEITYVPPSEGSGVVTPTNGGTAIVSDPSSELFGAKIEIPPGAATRSFTASIIFDPEHVPNLPFGFVACGPPVVFSPEAEVFTAEVMMSIPFDITSIPQPASLDDVQVLGLSGNEWVPVPITVQNEDQGLLQFQLDSFEAGPFVPAVFPPLESGQVLIETSPPGAAIYIDNVLTPYTTPKILDGISLGQHVARLYLPPYNEIYYEFTSSPTGARIEKDLIFPEPTSVLTVLIDPIFDGLVTSSPFIEITGRVLRDGEALTGGVVTISVNEEEFTQSVNSDGTINGFVTLQPGYNAVGIRVTHASSISGVSEPAMIRYVQSRRLSDPKNTDKIIPEEEVPHMPASIGTRSTNSAIIITLSWNTDTTDIDMHVFDPLGNHAFYSNKNGIPGAMIDVDDRNGFGPEVFTYSNPVEGTYRVAVDSYRIGGINTVATLSVSVDGRTIFSDSYLFTDDDRNQSNGSPVGANPAAFWDAFTFEVGDIEDFIKIEEVNSRNYQWLSYTQAIFTTHPSENEIYLVADAPAAITDDTIAWDIIEPNEDYDITSMQLVQVGRLSSFSADHKPLSALTTPRYSRPIEYEIVAFEFESQGGTIVRTGLESPSIRISQDPKSQIRQEFIDKRNFDSGFNIPTPDRASIISANEFTIYSPHFSFREIAKWNDFYETTGLAVIDDSVNIANKLRAAWGHPLRVTSGWRNPRRNDDVGGVLNSLHQSGNAIDLNPMVQGTWPATVEGFREPITTYDLAQKALTSLAKRIFDPDHYWVDFHNNHLHIERESPTSSPVSSPTAAPSPAPTDASCPTNTGGAVLIPKKKMTQLGESFVDRVYWLNQGDSGVTLAWGYDMGNKSPATVKSVWTTAGMSVEQANILSEGAGLKMPQAKSWVQNNVERVGNINRNVADNVLEVTLQDFRQSAKLIATSTTPTTDSDGYYTNARGRELQENKPLYTYVLTEEQWESLHPAMIELITDMKYQGGYYLWDRVARVNERLIANDGDQLAQFRAVATLFEGSPSGGLSYMDSYCRRWSSPCGIGNTEVFFDGSAADIAGASERRNRIRLSFLKKVIKALEAGDQVVLC